MKPSVIFSRALLGLATSLALPAVAAAGPTAADTPAHELKIGVAQLATAPLPGAYVRTPEGIELVLAQEIAQATGATLHLHQPRTRQDLRNNPDALGLHLNFARVQPGSAAPSGAVHTALAHEISPMAIMRTDTDIRQWSDLRTRSVCMVTGSPWVGQMSSRHGATEQLYGTPTEALIAMRVGECDAMVHDDRFLDILLTYPEWQKFSAQLRDNSSLALVMVTAANDKTGTALAQKLARQWQNEARIDKLLKSRAQEIAFEVYLEQDAVDCH